MCSFHSRGSDKLYLTSTSTGYFISSPLLPLPIFTWQTATHPNTVPRTLTLLKLDPKVSFLVNKQPRDLFSAQHTLYSQSSSSWFPLLVLLPLCQIFWAVVTSPGNQCFAITCFGHILSDTTWTRKTNMQQKVGERKAVCVISLNQIQDVSALLLTVSFLILLLIRKTVSELIKSNDSSISLSRGPWWIITLSPPLISFSVLRAHGSSPAITTAVSTSHSHMLTQAHTVSTRSHPHSPHGRNNLLPQPTPTVHCPPSLLYVRRSLVKVFLWRGKVLFVFIK